MACSLVAKPHSVGVKPSIVPSRDEVYQFGGKLLREQGAKA
jgi:hypothetical protein